MTSKEKWEWVCSELEKLKDLEARVKKIEGYAESRTKNKQGTGAHVMFDPNAPDPPRPPLDKPET